MAILSGKRARNGPSSGHDFDRTEDKIWGSMRGKINKMGDVYNSDYIYVYRERQEDDIVDGEVGANKMRHRIHDIDWFNGEKNEHHAMNRFFDGLSEYDDAVLTDLDDIVNADGTINFDELEDFLGEE